MNSHGYEGILKLLDSGDWIPQRRQRAYFVFSKGMVVKAQQVFQVALSVRSQCTDLKALLIQPLARSAVKKKTGKLGQRAGRWVQKTTAFIQKYRVKEHLVRLCKGGLQKSSDFDGLTPREQILLSTQFAYLLQCKRFLVLPLDALY